MHLFRHIQPLRDALNTQRAQGKTIGFVPTMGNLHRGHLALIETARQHCDVVVASIFVNPLQFGLNEDWDQYPRTFESDSEKLTEVGCDYLFFPADQEMYPNGMADQVKVISPALTDILCGASRPGHFDGVTTVVAKLFNIVQPDAAVFGLKDFQQITVIRRMVEDLCIPVKIIPGRIVREEDGLAMSSRNSFISATERPMAIVLNQTLNWMKSEIEQGRRDYTRLEAEGTAKIQGSGFRSDYLQVRTSDSLSPAGMDDAELTILGAMYTKAARLIDNVSLILNR